MDLTIVQLFGMHLLTAIVDGFSQRLIAMRVYRTAPATEQITALLPQAIKREGQPRFLITDQGCRFRKVFVSKLILLGVKLIQGRVGSWHINLKIERLNRTLKLWKRLSHMGLSTAPILRRLDWYRVWYNRCRPHVSLGILTLDEAVAGQCLPEAIPIRWHGYVEPSFEVGREHLDDDPHLPIIKIDATLRPRLAA